MQSGKTWSDIAKHNYMAYAASLDNKNSSGEPLPTFENLPKPVQVAWEATCRHVGYCIQDTDSDSWPAESIWSGWTPPTS